MRKTYKVILTSSALITVDVEENEPDNVLLNKIEIALDKGFVENLEYFEVEGEVENEEWFLC